MTPPTFACAGVFGLPLLFGALPVTPGSEDAWPPWRVARTRASPGLCLGSRGFGLGSGGLTAVRSRALSVHSAPPAPFTLPTVRRTSVSCGANLQTGLASNTTSHRAITDRHWTANTELPVHQARRFLHLRAPRSPNRQDPAARSVGACSAAAALALRGRPRIRRRATLPRSPRPTAQRCRHAAHLWVVAPSALAHRLTLGLRPSRTGLASHGSLAKAGGGSGPRTPQTATPPCSAALPRPRALSFSSPGTGSAPSSVG